MIHLRNALLEFSLFNPIAYCTVKVRQNLDAAIVLATTRKLMWLHVTCMWHVHMCYDVLTDVFKIVPIVLSLKVLVYISTDEWRNAFAEGVWPHRLVLACFSWSSDYQRSSTAGFKTWNSDMTNMCRASFTVYPIIDSRTSWTSQLWSRRCGLRFGLHQAWS